MNIIPLPLKGAYQIVLKPNFDERGSFTRTFCKLEFKKYGLKTNFIQSSISYNKRKNQVRGMHYQKKPFQETKLVSCIRGSIYDVIIDLRKIPNLSKMAWRHSFKR